MSSMPPAGEKELWSLLKPIAAPDGLRWLEDAAGSVRHDPSTLPRFFPAAGRNVGRGPLHPAAGTTPDPEHGWTVDDAARALLLLAAGRDAWAELADLYRFGDAAERRAVLRALPLLPQGDDTARIGSALVDDALRTNDPRLIAAALGSYALEHLGEDALNQAILKCVFVGVPLSQVPGLSRRATPALARMLAGYVHERVAAGRSTPPDVWPLIDAHPPEEELAAIEAELTHPVQERRSAADAALAQRASSRHQAGAAGTA